MNATASATRRNTVTKAIKSIGTTKIGRRFKIRPSAVQKWGDQGCLPKTELAGLTNYAEGIADLSRDTPDPVTIEQLLSDTRKTWQSRQKLDSDSKVA
jgi:hypothetical protein